MDGKSEVSADQKRGEKELTEQELFQLKEQLERALAGDGSSSPNASERSAAAGETASGRGNKPSVRITPDKMEAWLYLCEPPKGKFYTKDELLDFLQQNNVVTGYINSNISAMCKKGVYNREIKVAAGRKPRDGRDGWYEFYFEVGDFSKSPKIREDGSVDYSSMRSLQNVKRGDKVATYHTATQAEDGFNVMGGVIKASPAKDLPPLTGRGISKENDPYTYIANTDGKIEIKDNKVDIQTVYEVMDDLDLITGKVEFYGDVVISGSVGTGVVVRAGRNLTIDGTVEACNLYAGGDIVLRRGVQGAEKAQIRAKGNVYAEFLEYAKVRAGGDVQANIILNCDIQAEGRVILNGNKGSIIGGSVHALRGMEMQNLGNAAEVRTVVHAGYLAEDYDEYVSATKEENGLKEEMSELVEELSLLLKSKKSGGAKLSHLQQVRAKDLNDKRDKLFSSLENVRQKRNELKKMIEAGKGAAILVKGNVNRGSVICIENGRLPVEQSTSFMEYKAEHGVINGKVISL